MPIYKNLSCVEKTFFGVRIKPGEVKNFPNHVLDSNMVLMKSLPKEPPAVIKPLPSSLKPKKEVKTSTKIVEENKQMPAVHDAEGKHENIEKENLDNKEVNT